MVRFLKKIAHDSLKNIEESLTVVEKVHEAVGELQLEPLLGEKQSLTSANEKISGSGITKTLVA